MTSMLNDDDIAASRVAAGVPLSSSIRGRQSSKNRERDDEVEIWRHKAAQQV
jgi:hypothetical protein